eukprot:582235_1
MPQQIEKKKDTTNRYDLVGVSNTWMTLPMKNNKRQLKIKGRGRTAKTISIDCPKELNEDVTDDVDELWSTFKEQYDENLNEEIDKILKYANAKDRKQAFDEKWKSKKAHWEKQDTEQRKLNKDYYRTKWKQFIDIVKAHRKSNPKLIKKEPIKKKKRTRKKRVKNDENTNNNSDITNSAMIPPRLPLQPIDTNNRATSVSDQRTVSQVIHPTDPSNSIICNRIHNPATVPTVVVDPRTKAVHLILPGNRDSLMLTMIEIVMMTMIWWIEIQTTRIRRINGVMSLLLRKSKKQVIEDSSNSAVVRLG